MTAEMVGLENGQFIGRAGYLSDIPHNLVVVPPSREFRFSWPPCPVPVPAAPVVPVEDVLGAFGCRAQ